MRRLVACEIVIEADNKSYRPSHLALQLADGSSVGDCVKHL